MEVKDEAVSLLGNSFLMMFCPPALDLPQPQSPPGDNQNIYPVEGRESESFNGLDHLETCSVQC